MVSKTMTITMTMTMRMMVMMVVVVVQVVVIVIVIMMMMMMMSSEYGPYLLLVVPARRIHRLYNVDGVGDEQSVKCSTSHHA